MPGMADLIGGSVEARTVGGGIVRGELLGVSGGFLIVERSSTRRRTFVSVAHLVALVDEAPAGLGRREAAELTGEDARPRRGGLPASEGGEP